MAKSFSLLILLLMLVACTEDNRDASAGTDPPVQNPPTGLNPDQKRARAARPNLIPPPGGTGGLSAEYSRKRMRRLHQAMIALIAKPKTG